MVDGSLATFSMPLVVDEDDIDALGHASNIAYVRWIQQVAQAHSSARGWAIEDYQRVGGVFVVRRQEVDYLRSALRGEQLELRTRIDRAMAAKCLRATEIANAKDEIIARAMTTWGYIELATGRPTRIPAAVRVAFGM